MVRNSSEPSRWTESAMGFAGYGLSQAQGIIELLNINKTGSKRRMRKGPYQGGPFLCRHIASEGFHFHAGEEHSQIIQVFKG